MTMLIGMLLFSAVCAGMVLAGFRDLAAKPTHKSSKKNSAET
ncbi:MAG: hypothetical protein ACYDCD_03910 [Candidatus Acidiferrales bacterium]